MRSLRSSRRLRITAFLVVGIVATGLSLLAYLVNGFRAVERATVDARFSVRGDRETPRDLVVVQVDDVTFDELDLQWPFPRSVHGKVIDRLRKAGAKTIAYDVQFTEPTEEAEDNALIDAVDAAPRVVLATTEVDEKGRSNVFGGEELLREIGARAGNTVLNPDPGGVLRRADSRVQGLDSMPVAVTELNTKRQVDLPERDDGRFWIDYAGPPGAIPHVSFSRVASGKFSAERFRGKTVVVGASAPTLRDVHTTPTSGEALMSGPEVQANAIDTVRRGYPLSESPVGLNVVLIVLLGMVTPLASMRLSPVLAFGLAGLLGIAYTAVVQLAFNGGTILPLLHPLAALVLAAVGTLAVHLLLTALERDRARSVFARFVPEAVVNEVLSRTDDDLRLGGVRLTSTVLFSDLRGFTSASETLEPDQVIDVLNRYLSEMSDAIMAHGGTLVCYMGDGIMAVFGAPLEQPDQADRALAAAREMVGPRLESFNAWLREQGLHREGFRMGVGLNAGPVMAGNVGSESRMDYTAVGDTVNTASRLEGMTKGSLYQVLVSDSAHGALKSEAPDLEDAGEFEVRGREAKVRLWGLVETAAD